MQVEQLDYSRDGPIGNGDELPMLLPQQVVNQRIMAENEQERVLFWEGGVRSSLDIVTLKGEFTNSITLYTLCLLTSILRIWNNFIWSPKN